MVQQEIDHGLDLRIVRNIRCVVKRSQACRYLDTRESPKVSLGDIQYTFKSFAENFGLFSERFKKRLFLVSRETCFLSKIVQLGFLRAYFD